MCVWVWGVLVGFFFAFFCLFFLTVETAGYGAWVFLFLQHPIPGVCWHSCLCSHLANLTRVLILLGRISCRASSWSYTTYFYVGPHFLSGYCAATVYKTGDCFECEVQPDGKCQLVVYKTTSDFFFFVLSTLNTPLGLRVEGYQPS